MCTKTSVKDHSHSGEKVTCNFQKFTYDSAISIQSDHSSAKISAKLFQEKNSDTLQD